MNKLTSSPTAAAESLCLSCGLCCNGVLFKDVELREGDNAEQLESIGLPLERLKKKIRFPQPCAALCGDNRCRIYADRPVRCRQFECALLKEVNAGHVEMSAALRIVRTARERAGKVQRRLAELGDTDTALALSIRFRRTKRRVESGALDEETAETFSRLTLAVHDLNLLLRDSFFLHE
ncbi:MAG: YkgJ family cysteine cluster protein [Verrucomicrobia bacterium]|nr:YkgJ family cysteine cluster protein [Verrucomicrobiota bacterium]